MNSYEHMDQRVRGIELLIWQMGREQGKIIHHKLHLYPGHAQALDKPERTIQVQLTIQGDYAENQLEAVAADKINHAVHALFQTDNYRREVFARPIAKIQVQFETLKDIWDAFYVKLSAREPRQMYPQTLIILGNKYYIFEREKCIFSRAMSYFLEIDYLDRLVRGKDCGRILRPQHIESEGPDFRCIGWCTKEPRVYIDYSGRPYGEEPTKFKVTINKENLVQITIPKREAAPAAAVMDDEEAQREEEGGFILQRGEGEELPMAQGPRSSTSKSFKDTKGRLAASGGSISMTDLSHSQAPSHKIKDLDFYTGMETDEKR
jgi:hypothetical protein